MVFQSYSIELGLGFFAYVTSKFYFAWYGLTYQLVLMLGVRMIALLDLLDTTCDCYIVSIGSSSATINLKRAVTSSSVSQEIQVKKSDSLRYFRF